MCFGFTSEGSSGGGRLTASPFFRKMGFFCRNGFCDEEFVKPRIAASLFMDRKSGPAGKFHKLGLACPLDAESGTNTSQKPLYLCIRLMELSMAEWLCSPGTSCGFGACSCHFMVRSLAPSGSDSLGTPKVFSIGGFANTTLFTSLIPEGPCNM